MLKPKEANYISTVFNNLDHDKTGYLTSEEFTTALKKSDPSLHDDDAKEILEEIDYAENGKINYSEFLVAWIDPKFKEKGRVKTIFNQFDIDGSGYITEDNIKAKLGIMSIDNFTQDEIDQVLNTYGTDKGIDLQSFTNLLEQ